MQKKSVKKQNQTTLKWQNARLQIKTKKKADAILKKANQKNLADVLSSINLSVYRIDPLNMESFSS